MKFTGKDQQEVELKILGYEFPTLYDNVWDANWLRVYLKIKSNVGDWQTIDASLLNMELKTLIEWLIDLSQNKKVEKNEMSFIEPNLSFKIKSTSQTDKTIQIIFDFESRPLSAKSETEYSITFKFSNNELGTIAKDLIIEYEKFPIRQIETTTPISPTERIYKNP